MNKKQQKKNKKLIKRTMFAEKSRLRVDVLVVEETTVGTSGLENEHLSVGVNLFGDLFHLGHDENERARFAHFDRLLAHKHQRWTYVL